MQIRHVGIEPRGLELGVGNSRGPLERIPVNLEIRAQTQAMRNAGLEHSGQIKQTDFLAASRKTEVRTDDLPATFAVRNFHTQRLRLFLLTLADRDVNRRVSRVHPPVRDEPKRTVCRCVVTEIELDVMIARDALVLTATKRVQVFSVYIIDDGSDVLPLIIDSARDFVWRRDSRDRQLRRSWRS